MSQSVQAVVRDGDNDPPVSLKAVDAPPPGPGEALVEVRASTINRGELALLSSRADGWRPGQDLAGVVDQAAADGSGPPAGTRVFGTVDAGAWATRATAPTSRLAILPDGVPFEAAAGLGIAGLTALRVLRRAGSLLGRRVRITAASGGVGHLLVQLAQTAGARVSADEPEDGAFDVVFEGIGGRALERAVRALRPGGSVILYGASDPQPANLTLLDFVGREGASIVSYFSYAAPEPDPPDLAILADLVNAGRLTPAIAATYPLAETAAAIKALTARQVHGKVILTTA